MNAPIKSGATLEGQWRNLNTLGAGHDLHAVRIQGQAVFPAASANGRMRRQFAQEPMFPFRMYRIPDWYRTSPDPATDWRKFCVRLGKVFVNWADVAVTGADDCTLADDESFPLTAGAGVNEVTVPDATAAYWFWLDITGSTVAVNSSATAPTWGPGAIPIGYIDTATGSSQRIARCRQLLRTDLFTCA